MRVLAMVTDAYGGRGGIAQAAKDVIGALAANSEVASIDVHPRHAPEPYSDLPLKVSQLPAMSDRFRYALQVLRQAITARPDVIFCNHLYMAPLAALAVRLSGAKLVIQLHGVEIWKPPSEAQRQAVESADVLLCVSRYTRTQALGFCDLAPERAIVINNTVDPRFVPGDRAEARAKFRLAEEYALLIVGRLDSRERYKGHDRVIEALPQLYGPNGRPIVFMIAGDGDDRPRLEERAIALGLSDRVRFLAQVPGPDLPALYRAADLFVLPSSGEGFGIVFLEAMACGTPAVGLSAGGAPDALGDGALGTLADPAEDLAIVLQRAIHSNQTNKKSGLASAVIARFGIASFNRRICDAMPLLE